MKYFYTSMIFIFCRTLKKKQRFPNKYWRYIRILLTKMGNTNLLFTGNCAWYYRYKFRNLNIYKTTSIRILIYILGHMCQTVVVFLFFIPPPFEWQFFTFKMNFHPIKKSHTRHSVIFFFSFELLANSFFFLNPYNPISTKYFFKFKKRFYNLRIYTLNKFLLLTQFK